MQALDKKNKKESGLLVVKGFCMGTADVIPGVSGGTMAFILGIYKELIAAIKSFDQQWLKSLFLLHWKQALLRPHFGFLLPLFSGIVMALLFFTRVIPLPELLIRYPEQIYGLFFGLIAGSILILLQDMLVHGGKIILPIAAGTLLGALVFNLVPMHTPETAWFIFVSGCLAICAMILPGISGSFILLILNKYAYIFNAIGYFQFSILLPFILGAVTGLVFFSRVLSWLLARFYKNTILFIVGLLVASLWVIWPFQERIYETVRHKARLIESTPFFPLELTPGVSVSVLFIISGFAMVLMINKFAMLKSEQAASHD